MSGETSQHWRALGEHLWLIALCLALGAGVAYGYQRIAQPAYEANTSVRIALVDNHQDPVTLSLISDDLLNTDAQAATSDAVINLALTHLNGMTEAQVKAALTVQPTTGTNLLLITAHAASPQMAAAIANADASALIQYETSRNQQQNATREQPLNTQIAAAQTTITDLNQQVSALEAQGVSATDARVATLKAKLTAQQSSLKSLEASLTQLQISESLQEPTLDVQQQARPQSATQRPSLRSLLLAGGIAGLLAGILIASWLGAGKPRTRDRNNWRALFGDVPIITIPTALGEVEGATPSEGMQPEQIQAAFNALRMEVNFIAVARTLRVVVVTGEREGVGTSFVAAGLAAAWANVGKRVLLVDAHLERPTQHRYFGTPSAPGLSDALAADNHDSEFLWRTLAPANLPYLLLEPAGQRPPNQGQLLASAAMDQVMEAFLGSEAEMIIVDAPPISEQSGALALARRSGSVLLVVARDGGDRTEVAELLKSAEAEALAVVENEAPRENAAQGRPVKSAPLAGSRRR